MKYAIIGSGKLGHHLAHFFTLNGNSFTLFKRDSDYKLLKNFDYLLLAINDAEIKKFYDEHQDLHHKKWIHFSGTHYFKDIIGVHPLMSFSDELFDLSFYQKIHWVVDHPVEVEKILPINKFQISNIHEKDKPFYHALCVLSGNIPHLLWESVEKEFMKLNIEKKDFLNYVKITTDNYLQNRAATGPIVRKDQVTIDMNLKSLTKPYQEIYQGVMGIQNENNSRL